MCASLWGHLQVVERILAAGAQPDLCNNVRIACTETYIKDYIRDICLWQLNDSGITNLLYAE